MAAGLGLVPEAGFPDDGRSEGETFLEELSVEAFLCRMPNTIAARTRTATIIASRRETLRGSSMAQLQWRGIITRAAYNHRMSFIEPGRILSVPDQRNPQAKEMADESMVRNLPAQADAIWPQEKPLFERLSDQA